MNASRPALIVRPTALSHQKKLREKLAEYNRQLPDGIVNSMSDVGIACRIFVLTMVLWNRRIDTDLVLQDLTLSNPDLLPFLRDEPLLYDAACSDIAALCRGQES